MKKLLLGLGTVTSVITPIAAVVACGGEGKPQVATNNVHATYKSSKTTLGVLVDTYNASEASKNLSNFDKIMNELTYAHFGDKPHYLKGTNTITTANFINSNTR